MSDSPEPTEKLSKDGKYKFLIKKILTKPGCWNYLSIDVIRCSDNKLVGTTTRNYATYGAMECITQDGIDYLIISENYHGGYGVMRLDTGERFIYDPKLDPIQIEKFKDSKFSAYWCWASFESHNADAKTLTIEGCFWGAPYERIVFDISNITSFPYPVISIEDLTEDYDDEDEDEDEDAS